MSPLSNDKFMPLSKNAVCWMCKYVLFSKKVVFDVLALKIQGDSAVPRLAAASVSTKHCRIIGHHHHLQSKEGLSHASHSTRFPDCFRLPISYLWFTFLQLPIAVLISSLSPIDRPPLSCFLSIYSASHFSSLC